MKKFFPTMIRPAHRIHSIIGALLVLLAASSPALAQTKPLIDLGSQAASDRVRSGTEQVTHELVSQGLAVGIESGDAKYPGITIHPDGDTWDLSDFGHIEARITNLGNVPLNLSMRIDNYASEKKSVWNVNRIRINAGSTETIKVVFGYDYGSKLGYELDSSKILSVLLFTGHTKEAKSFVIEQIVATGATGEKPPPQPRRHAYPSCGWICTRRES